MYKDLAMLIVRPQSLLQRDVSSTSSRRAMCSLLVKPKTVRSCARWWVNGLVCRWPESASVRSIDTEHLFVGKSANLSYTYSARTGAQPRNAKTLSAPDLFRRPSRSPSASFRASHVGSRQLRRALPFHAFDKMSIRSITSRTGPHPCTANVHLCSPTDQSIGHEIHPKSACPSSSAQRSSQFPKILKNYHGCPPCTFWWTFDKVG